MAVSIGGSAPAALAAGMIAVTCHVPDAARAQLPQCTHIDQALLVDAPGGCIEKSLSEQIGAGHGDATTPGSAVYLIKRDPARSIRRGRQLFQRKFTAAEGLGPRVSRSSEGDVTTSRALGAGLSDSCASCHGRPRGSAGHGGDVSTFPDSRDAPHLFGLGLIEMLGDEITADLRAIRDEAIAAARGGSHPSTAAFAAGETSTSAAASTFDRVRSFFGMDSSDRRGHGSRTARRGGSGKPDHEHGPRDPRGQATRRLVSKGIDFGAITAFRDGTVDTSRVEGVDADLRVRPFFHDGRAASIREFIVGALNDEMGLQAWDPILCAVTNDETPAAQVSPGGYEFDPAEDHYGRPPSCDRAEDPDGDGVAGEVDPAIVDHLEFYLLNYFKPAQYHVTARAAEGLVLMDDVGCTSCHVKDLTIERDRRIADVETTFDPERGIFNELYAEAYPLLREVDDGDPYPRLLPLEQPFVVENVFTDLKRHDLGPYFHERDYDGSRITQHVTEPLWGVGNTAPYGHDGRSVNLDAVIRRHGGEAAEVTAAYLALGEDDRAKIIDFLETLIVFPPDDTASNLNPGATEGDMQIPANHGGINLGALFRIDIEGAE